MYVYLIRRDVYEDGVYVVKKRTLAHELKFDQVLFDIYCNVAIDNGCNTPDEIANYLIMNDGYRPMMYQGVYEY